MCIAGIALALELRPGMRTAPTGAYVQYGPEKTAEGLTPWPGRAKLRLSRGSGSPRVGQEDRVLTAVLVEGGEATTAFYAGDDSLACYHKVDAILSSYPVYSGEQAMTFYAALENGEDYVLWLDDCASVSVLFVR